VTEHQLDLTAAEEVAQSRRADWERQGLAVEFRYWQPTEKPCALLRLHTRTNEGELLFWGSGEVELAVGSSPEDSYQRHEDGVTAETIGALMDEVAERVLTAP
jgi:hypothetical protein